MNLRACPEPDDLRRALHPLEAPPEGDPFNLVDLHDMLPADSQPVPAAVLMGIVERDGCPRVLLTVRTAGLRHHAGQVSFPGGRIETGDAGALAAALREANEEIGLEAISVEPIGYLDPLLTISGFRVTPLVAWIDPAFEPKPDPQEVDEVFEVPLIDLITPHNLQVRELQVGGRARDVYEYVGPGAQGRRIWGATASILHNFARRLENG